MNVSFGTWWSDNPRSFPRWRVEWSEVSGHLFAVNNSNEEQLEIFCQMKDRADIDSLMEGWSDHIYEPCSLEWIRRRCSDLADQLCGITEGGR